MSNRTDITEPQPVRTRGISLPPATLLDVVAGRPVYNIAGGSGEGDEGGDKGGDGDDPEGDEPEGAAGGDEDEEPEGEDKPKPKPPAAKAEEYTPPPEAEWKRTRDALKKANDDAKKHRLRNRELEEAARANESEQEKHLREAREAGETRYRAPLVKAAARAALGEAGVNGSTERVLRLVDTESLSVDDDGEVIGLAGEIDRVRQEYPEFFQGQEKPRPKTRPTAANREPAKEKPKSSAEQHAMKVLGRTAS
jgi:hypothetical protein